MTSQSKNCQHFYNIIDTRTQLEKQRQLRQVQQIYESNLKTFNIKMTKKRKVKFEPASLIKVDLGQGWYANITDNMKKSDFTIFTIHGAPGNHIEWAGLQTQMWDTCRWVNFIIPGFDNQDQRRGNYSGSVSDLSEMIIRIMKARKIPKIILCGHSLGSIFASYFINKHSEYVHGYINITGIVNMWYVGLMTFYRVCIANYGFGKGPNKKSLFRLLDKDQYREKHHTRFINDTRDVYFGPVQFPDLSVTQMCAYIKLIGSLQGGCSQFYSLNKKLNILKVLIFGKIDPLHQHNKTAEQIYSITRGNLNWHKQPNNHRILSNPAFQEELKQTLKKQFNIQIDPNRLQQYFCYHFQTTGHNAHKRRPKQISIILRVYLVTIGIWDKYSQLLSSKL